MVEPLREPDFFSRVVLDDGTWTWPNDFDLDAIALHMEMKERGQLRRTGGVAGGRGTPAGGRSAASRAPRIEGVKKDEKEPAVIRIFGQARIEFKLVDPSKTSSTPSR